MLREVGDVPTELVVQDLHTDTHSMYTHTLCIYVCTLPPIPSTKRGEIVCVCVLTSRAVKMTCGSLAALTEVSFSRSETHACSLEKSVGGWLVLVPT